MSPCRDRLIARRASQAAVGCVLATVGLVALHDALPRSFLPFIGGIFAACGALLAVVLAVVASRMAERYERLVQGEGCLAMWLVDDAAWQRFRVIDGALTSVKARSGVWFFVLMAALLAAAAVGVLLDDPGT